MLSEDALRTKITVPLFSDEVAAPEANENSPFYLLIRCNRSVLRVLFV